ncbi:condensation domain-containing protein [Streptomyces sp. NPDC008125]|uniref:condensation domain-containing protein n=1 Tax=Streptomyces sp. NPDC008125 TaxID=3364811 RepID=UPI0036E5C9E7
MSLAAEPGHAALHDAVLGIHRAALEDDSVLAEDNFYDMGGDSILALQVLGRIERELGVKVPAQAFFTAESISEVAVRVATERSPGTGAAASGDTTHRGRASMAQEWAFLSASRDPRAPVLQFHVVFRVRGPLDTDRLGAALRAVARRNESLRTSFRAEGESVALTVEPCPEIGLETMEYAGVGDADLDAFLRGYVRRPFDRSRAPLWRALAVRRGADDHVLVLVFDHMIADGWSLDTFVSDLSAVCTTGELPPPAAGSGAYAEWAAGQWRRWESGRQQELTSYWRSQLPTEAADFGLRLPGYQGTGELAKPSSLVLDVAPETARALREASQALRATPYCVSMAVVKALVAQVTGRPRVTLLTTNANRLDGAYQNTVGWFANGVFPTTDVDLSGSFRDLVGAVRQSVLGATAHGDMPAMYVRRGIWPQLPAGFRKDPGVYFMYNDVWGSGLDFGDGIEVTPHHLVEDADSPGLHMWLLREGETLRLQVLHYASEYPADYVTDFAGRLLAALGLLTGEPDRPMSELLTP